MPTTTLEIPPIPPFRLDLTVWVLKRRHENVIDAWDGREYRRTMRFGADLVGVSIRQVSPPENPKLEVTLSGSDQALSSVAKIVTVTERLLGTTVELTGFYQLAQSDSRLQQLATRFKGFKPTRYPTMFECLTNAITCQLVSLNVGLRVVSRLVEHYGERLTCDSSFPPAFPTPQSVADADPDVLRKMGFSRQKARALIELAEGITTRAIDLDALEQQDDASAIDRLTAIRGIGRWTAEYALLRGLGRLHIFPGDDVGARNTLQRWIESEESLGYHDVREALSSWDPYGGLIYFQMLLLGLESKGGIAVQT